MKKVIKITLGSLMIAFGIGVMLFGGIILMHADIWVMVFGFIPFLIIGASLMLAGWEITRGAKIYDILRDLFMNFTR